MDISQVRADTAAALGEFAGDTDYVTDDLVRQYDEDAVDLDKVETDSAAVAYGHSIVVRSGRIYWTSGKPGTDHHGCGSGFRYSRDASRYRHEYEGACPDGKNFFAIVRR